MRKCLLKTELCNFFGSSQLLFLFISYSYIIVRKIKIILSGLGACVILLGKFYYYCFILIALDIYIYMFNYCLPELICHWEFSSR